MAGGWESVVAPGLDPSMVSIVSEDVGAGIPETTIAVAIPAFASYEIAQPETIEVLLPAAVLASEQDVLASPSFVLDVAGATGLDAAGSLAPAAAQDASGGGWGAALDEAALTAPGTLHNLTVQLTGDAWLDSLPPAALLSGLVSGQSEPGGWNAIVRPALGVRHLSLLDNATALLAARAALFAAYDIAAPETIAIEVPAGAVASAQPAPIVPTFIIRARPGDATVGGAIVNASDELSVVGPTTLELLLTLHGSTWADAVGVDEEATLAVLRSLTAQQTVDADTGWNAVVRAGLRARHAQRLDASQLRISLVQFGRYDIDAPETIDVVLPPDAQSSGTNLTSRGVLVVTPRAGELALSGGSLLRAPYEASVQQGATTLELRLLGDSWRSDLAPNATRVADGAAPLEVRNASALTATLLRGFASTHTNGSHADAGYGRGWDAVVAPLLLSHGSIEVRDDCCSHPSTLPTVPSPPT